MFRGHNVSSMFAHEDSTFVRLTVLERRQHVPQ